MPTTPNYNQSSLAGDSWVRAHKVVIHNPYGGTPWLQLMEQKIFLMSNESDQETVTRDCSSLTVTFDPTNEKHLALYNLLNEIYVEERDKRDGTTTVLPSPSIPPVS